jgi:transcription antitermination factor NusA-like protein
VPPGQDIVAKGYSKIIAGEDFQESHMMVHPSYLADIIGKGGANIRAIQDATSVKLVIPQVTPTAANVTSR